MKIQLRWMLVLFMPVLFLHPSSAQAATKVIKNSIYGYQFTQPNGWVYHNDGVSTYYLVDCPKYSPTDTTTWLTCTKYPQFDVNVSPWLLSDSEKLGLATKGWDGFVAAYTKEEQTLMKVQKVTVREYSATSFWLNGQHIFKMSFIQAHPYSSERIVDYFITKDGHQFFHINTIEQSNVSSMPKNAHATEFQSLLTSFRITAPVTKVTTNTKGGFSTRVPAWYKVFQQSMQSNFTPDRSIDAPVSGDVTILRLDDPAYFSTKQIAAYKAALKKGWSNLVTAYVKDVRSGLAGTTGAPGSVAEISLSTPQPYGLNGYTASVFSYRFSIDTSAERGVFVLVTKDQKTVYVIFGNSYNNLFTPAGKKMKLSELPNPFNYDFRLIAQNFRIL